MAKWPATAVAAATAGETRCVRPPLPWRPSKLRFDVDAQRSPGSSLSGFIARHIEQPGFAPLEPGRGEHRVESLGLGVGLHLHRARAPRARASRPCTCRPRTTSAAARRSSMPRVRARADEHGVDRDVAHRRARLQSHVPERVHGRRRAGRGRGTTRDRERRRRSSRSAPGSCPSSPTAAGVARVDDELLVEHRAVVGGERAPVVERGLPGLARRRELAGPRGTRTSCRRARSSRRARPLRSTCCRPSCGLPSRALRIARAAVLDDRTDPAAGADAAR